MSSKIPESRQYTDFLHHQCHNLQNEDPLGKEYDGVNRVATLVPRPSLLHLFV